MLHVVLYRPQIPQNTGSISRTCAVTGTKLHLIRDFSFSIESSAVKRAGLDYWDMLYLEVHENLEAFLQKYGDKDIYLCSKFGEKRYCDVEYKDDTFIIFGREQTGLPECLHQLFKNRVVRVPMQDVEGARSLNLSNTVSLVLYEALRQNDFFNLV